MVLYSSTKVEKTVYFPGLAFYFHHSMSMQLSTFEHCKIYNMTERNRADHSVKREVDLGKTF
jgi:hypothetical protein